MSLRRFAPVFFVVSLVATQARADNTADEADVAFALGNRAYAHREYEEALKDYFLSYRLVHNRNVLFNIARCYEALDRFNEAYRYYNDLLEMDLPPDDQREVTAALARIRPQVALVRIQTEPPDAEIFVEREDLGSRGKSPQTLALPPGKHLVLVRKEGFHPAQATVSLVRGREVSRNFKLELVVGHVRLEGTPEQAWVRESADGPTLGTVPGEISLPPGRHVLFVGARGFATSQLVVDVRADQTTRLDVALASQPLPTGKVILTANRENALIRVDGRDSGFTPTVLTLPAGEHLIDIHTQEMRSWQKVVQVPQDGEVRLHAELRYAPPAVEAAAKALRPLDEAPASITVITREEIRAFGYQTLAEALQAVRGIFLTDDRQYTYLGIRGFSPPGDLNTRVLILYDGHAMNDVWAGQGYAGRDLDMDLDEVERIEVVRGPGSALYGTGALFAVINVVPRNRLEGGRNVEATGGVGGLGSWHGHLTGALGGPEASALVSVSGYGAAGAEVTDLGQGTGGLVYGLDGESGYHASARARLVGFTFHASFNHRTKDIPTAPYGTLVGAPGTQVNDDRAFAELRYDRDLSFGAFFARAYYDASRYRGYWIYAGTDGDRTSTDSGGADWIGAESRLRLDTFENNLLNLGVEGQVQLDVHQEAFGFTQDARTLQTRTRALISAYVLDELKLHPRLTVSAGMRVDKYSDLENVQFSPRLALIARPYDGGLTKLVVGTAFRAPNVYELYYEDFGQTQKPALHLEPEYITTFELEHSHNLSEELRVTVAGYWNFITQLVELLPEGAPTPGCGTPDAPVQCIVYRNAFGDAVQAYGAEAEVRWQPGRFALVDLSYSFVGLKLPSASQGLAGTEDLLTLVPMHLVSGRLMIPLGDTGVRLSTQAVYQSARGQSDTSPGVGDALLVNVGISGDLGFFRYFAGVKNLLDAHYSLPNGSSPDSGPPLIPQYGRTFLVQLTGSY